MRISAWFYSINLQKSFDFYKRVFDLDEEDLKNLKGFSVPIGNHFELKISTEERPLNTGNIEINDANIEETYERFIKNHVPETSESNPHKMKSGTFSGPWEYPGGMALFLKDPDNHSIFFMEW
jgi:hypothetical protein